MIPSLKAGKIDAILASMSITAARLKVIDFTSEVFSSPTAMVYRQGTRLEAPSGQSVGYLQGSIQEVYAKQVLAKAGMKVVAYPDQEQVYADLITGRLQASATRRTASPQRIFTLAPWCRFCPWSCD
jgi:histidine transport system substrate-binding protein